MDELALATNLGAVGAKIEQALTSIAEVKSTQTAISTQAAALFQGLEGRVRTLEYSKAYLLGWVAAATLLGSAFGALVGLVIRGMLSK